jgi:large subunit ribosomal protein L19
MLKKKESKSEENINAPAYLSDLNFYPELRKDIPKIKSGDIIDLSYRIVEGGKEKIQHYKGTVIALKGTGISRTITVRKMSFGVAVERIFPLNSIFVKEIKIERQSKVRRAKLYYLRKLRGKASRLKPLR